MSVIGSWTLLFALATVAAIGIGLLFRSPGRRAYERGADPDDGGDPIDLRRRRPLTQRLSGAVLVVASAVILMVVQPVLAI